MRQIVSTLSLIGVGLLSVGVATVAFSDSDDHHERHEREGHQRERHEHVRWLKPRADVAPVANETYREECSACHMAYQPGLLPADAWQQIMSPEGLADHYGDDAWLPDELRVELTTYLIDNSADKARRSRSRAFAVPSDGSVEGALPRISETRYFRHEHHEIPSRLVAGNPQVASFSQCNACHRGADEGVYNEHQVVIPGAGRWED
ncbi:Dihem cytochrome c [Thioflavicoccus mobilis 8321]|uniref:Dihem cytochrome c n=1 Tax=Thioflavicoccus mobilis 8321 TaxID=765912 RepID=L0GUT6_9GAMM|nr:diheme cytochrome c [Thioflavicoccus mobilis]AGA90503.1 Dihem cytochrome c [Thioflavicoccus mobilis 8321]